jgi:replicative DNA helicase
MVEIAKYGLDGDGTRIRLNELRSILGCWHRGDLVIIAGRPAMGKTSFVESILSDFAISGKAGIFLSLEMTALQVGYRLLSGLSVTDSRKYSAAELKTSAMYPTEEVATVVVPELQKRFKNRYSNNAGSLLFIDDQSNMNIAQIRAKVMQLIAGSRNPVGGVVIDYLGLIDDTTPTNKGDNKVNRIADITRALKCMAKEFAIPVILLCQLSRAVETRQDKRPILADLRDSGAIEQDADVVLFLHRPEYYRDCEEFVEHHTEGTQVSKEGYGEIIVAKNRNGGLGIAPFRFIAHCTAMVDYSEQPTAAPANYYEVEQVPF